MSEFYGPINEKEQAGTIREWFQNMPLVGNPDFVVYFNDFVNSADYAAADWVITTTEAGGGDATEALAADELNGALLITNDAADNDIDSLQMNEEAFKLQAGKRLWFETNLKVSDADGVDMMVGLSITDTTPRDSSDRIAFHLDDDAAALKFKVAKDSVETTKDVEIAAADSVYMKLGFYYDGGTTVKYFVNRVLKGSVSTNLPNDENLCLTLNLQNGTGAAKTMTVDYLYVCAER